MLTFYINEKTTEGKSLLAYMKKLNAPATAIRVEKKDIARKLTDEEMALPGFPPTDEEFENWITQKDTDTGSSVETVRKRLLKKLKTDFQ